LCHTAADIAAGGLPRLTCKDRKVIGTIMSGLLIGILLSRTLSGLIGAWLGWRGMFWVAAGLSFVLLLTCERHFPEAYLLFRALTDR